MLSHSQFIEMVDLIKEVLHIVLNSKTELTESLVNMLLSVFAMYPDVFCVLKEPSDEGV